MRYGTSKEEERSAAAAVVAGRCMTMVGSVLAVHGEEGRASTGSGTVGLGPERCVQGLSHDSQSYSNCGHSYYMGMAVYAWLNAEPRQDSETTCESPLGSTGYRCERAKHSPRDYIRRHDKRYSDGLPGKRPCTLFDPICLKPLLSCCRKPFFTVTASVKTGLFGELYTVAQA